MDGSIVEMAPQKDAENSRFCTAWFHTREPWNVFKQSKMYSIDSSSWEAEQGCPHYVALKAMGL